MRSSGCPARLSRHRRSDELAPTAKSEESFRVSRLFSTRAPALSRSASGNGLATTDVLKHKNSTNESCIHFTTLVTAEALSNECGSL